MTAPVSLALLNAPDRDLSKADVLPDSRLGYVATPKGAVWRNGAYWVPIFCNSCGKEGGLCPQENMTFLVWMCDPCFAKYGESTALAVVPDEVFWAKVKQEQLEKYGRELTPEELSAVVAAGASPLATLIREGR
jgi:hypothetical protein